MSLSMFLSFAMFQNDCHNCSILPFLLLISSSSSLSTAWTKVQCGSPARSSKAALAPVQSSPISKIASRICQLHNIWLPWWSTGNHTGWPCLWTSGRKGPMEFGALSCLPRLRFGSTSESAESLYSHQNQMMPIAKCGWWWNFDLHRFISHPSCWRELLWLHFADASWHLLLDVLHSFLGGVSTSLHVAPSCILLALTSSHLSSLVSSKGSSVIPISFDFLWPSFLSRHTESPLHAQFFMHRSAHP